MKGWEIPGEITESLRISIKPSLKGNTAGEPGASKAYCAHKPTRKINEIFLDLEREPFNLGASAGT